MLSRCTGSCSFGDMPAIKECNGDVLLMGKVCIAVVNFNKDLDTSLSSMSVKDLRQYAKDEAVHIPNKTRAKEDVRKKIIFDLCFLFLFDLILHTIWGTVLMCT